MKTGVLNLQGCKEELPHSVKVNNNNELSPSINKELHSISSKFVKVPNTLIASNNNKIFIPTSLVKYKIKSIMRRKKSIIKSKIKSKIKNYKKSRRRSIKKSRRRSQIF